MAVRMPGRILDKRESPVLREYCIPFMTLVLFALSYGTLAHAAGREGAPKLSPHAKLKSPGPADVRWTRGFWAQRFELCPTVTIPAIRRALQNPKNAAVLRNSRSSAAAISLVRPGGASNRTPRLYSSSIFRVSPGAGLCGGHIRLDE